LGVKQALAANAWWKTALVEAKIPAPESYYVSPLQRCLMTSNFTFTGLDLPSDRQFKPIIKEFLREFIGVHTCDRRGTKSKIRSLWPAYTFEANFNETDNLWEPDYRETGAMNINRMKLLLDDIFAHDKNTFISGTSHGGSIGSLLYGVGHTGFSLNTGGIVPVFLKAVRGEGPRPTPKIDSMVKNTICPSPTQTAAPNGMLMKQVDGRL
jgi:broad specificity phosphatase PhoE